MHGGWLGFELAHKLFDVPRVFPAAMSIVQRLYLTPSRIRFRISLLSRNPT
jgi:hypothetical protein